MRLVEFCAVQGYTPVMTIAVIFSLITAVWFIRSGLKHLSWSAILAKPVPMNQLGLHMGQVVAVEGYPHPHPNETYSNDIECVYLRITWQEYQERGFGRGRDHGGWRTTGGEVKVWDFLLCDREGKPILVCNDAYEARGLKKFGGDGPSHRKIREYLSFRTPLTVVGRVDSHPEYHYRLSKGRKVDMLLSSYTSVKQSQYELLSGWGKIIGGPIMLALCIYIVHVFMVQSG